MDTTSVSLLRRLRQPNPDDAWERFVELYSPLIYAWARRQGIAEADSADLVQDVLTVLVKELQTFEYNPATDRFRGWLRTITVNKVRDRQRRGAVRARLSADERTQILPQASIDLFEEDEYRNFIVSRAMELMKAEFRTDTWQACWQQVVEGRKAADVASELGLSLNMVYLAKSRVLGRLRDELSELLD